MTNDICSGCDLDREICSCAPSSVPPVKRGCLFATRPIDYWRDQFDPRDFKEGSRVT